MPQFLVMFYTQQSRQSRAFREEFGNALRAVTCALVYVCMAVFEAWSKCETMLYMPWLDDMMCTPGHLARTVCVCRSAGARWSHS